MNDWKDNVDLQDHSDRELSGLLIQLMTQYFSHMSTSLSSFFKLPLVSVGVLLEGLVCIQQIPRDCQEIITLFLPLLKRTVKQLPIVAESHGCPVSPPCDALAHGSTTVVAAQDSSAVSMESSAVRAQWPNQQCQS